MPLVANKQARPINVSIAVKLDGKDAGTTRENVTLRSINEFMGLETTLIGEQNLKSENVQVTVIEARNRIGGRVWTDRSLGVPVDMGASWIHGVEEKPITALAKRKIEVKRAKVP